MYSTTYVIFLLSDFRFDHELGIARRFQIFLSAAPMLYDQEVDDCNKYSTILLLLLIKGNVYNFHLPLAIKECSNNPCHQHATCADVSGSHTCTCNNGYTGDGYTCSGNKRRRF